MNTRWIPYDTSVDERSRREISFLLKTFLIIIPFVAIILAGVNFSLGLNQIGWTIMSVPVFCMISLFALSRGHLNFSITILISILILATTLSCVLGNGIHETGIIVLPVIVLFSSLVMNVRGVIVTTVAVVLCMAYIVFGEQFGFYPYNPVPGVRWVDLIVVLTVTIIHIFVTFSFTNITKKNLKRVKEELENQEQYKEEVKVNLEEKTELLRLVHHRVKNNLLLINSLIDIETYSQPKVKEDLTDLTQSIHTIARAHDPLYHSPDYKQVAIKPYLEKVILSHVQTLGIKGMEIQLDDPLIFHEKAILLSLIIQKIISNIETADLDSLRISLKAIDRNIVLEIAISNQHPIGTHHNTLIAELVKGLDGNVAFKPSEISVTFDAG